MRPIRLLLAGALAGATLLCAVPAPAAPLPPPTITGPAGASDRSIFVIGDSVLRGAADSIRSGLTADGWSTTVATLPGLPLKVGVQVLRENKPRIGPVVVIHLGNNLPDSVADYRAQVDETMTVLSDVHRVVWLTIQTFSPRRAEVNAVLREAATRYPNMEIADWAGMVAATPGLASRTDPHLSSSGRAAMTRLIRDRATAARRRGARCREATIAPTPPIDDDAWLWLLDSRGNVYGPPVPITGGKLRGAPVAIAAGRGGYWLVDSTGAVEAHGVAHLGDDAASTSRVTDLLATRTGRGYSVLRADGSVDNLGDAGSDRAPSPRLVPYVGMAEQPGFPWLVDGVGWMSGFEMAGPPMTVAIASAGTGGAWILGRDGAIYTVGNAPFLGAAGTEGFCIGQVAGAIAATPTGKGFWIITDGGVIAAFGDAPERNPVAVAGDAVVIDASAGR